MKRFFFDEEDDDEEDMMNEAENMLPGFIPEILAFPQQESQNVLNCSIKICESSFFWRFMSIEKKMKILSKVFENITTIIEKKEEMEE